MRQKPTLRQLVEIAMLTPPNDILKHLKPLQVRRYALAKGWQRVPGVNGQIALFGRPQATDDQLIVPMEVSAHDYAKRMQEVVANLAAFEARSPVEVLNDLITPDSDIVRYRVASPATGRGLIPLLEGIRLLEGAKRSLLAAAHSVINPVTHHPRMTRTEALQLVNGCQLGQTERNSFSVTLACPLRAVEQDQPLLPGIEPFTRQAVSMLIRSVARMVYAIEADQVPDVFNKSDGKPVLSANLCEAILQMQPEDEASVLAVQVSWAATLPPDKTLPSAVRIKHEYFPIFEDVAKKLQPTQPPSATMFVGYVQNLGGEPGDDGRMQGEATLAVMYEDQLQPARVTLSGDDWHTAHAALGVHGYVRVKGVFHRGTRVHRITDIREFARVQ